MLRFFLLLAFLPLCCFGKKYELSVCAIFQNEAPYLREWIEFHKLQGVQHFYLYNNNSDDDYKNILQPYLNKSEVTIIDWPYNYNHGDGMGFNNIQCGSYNDCLKKFGAETTWLALIDTDEYLFSPTGMTLIELLSGYKEYGALCANWFMFGSSGIYDLPENGLLIEYLTRCVDTKAHVNTAVKSIVQPEFALYCHNPHFFIFNNNKHAVDSNYNRVSGSFSQSFLHDKIVINHYFIRTERYLYEKKIPRRNKLYNDSESYLSQLNEAFNAFEDTAILQFVPKLRENMGYQSP